MTPEQLAKHPLPWTHDGLYFYDRNNAIVFYSRMSREDAPKALAIINAYPSLQSQLAEKGKRVRELESVLKEVIRISDRKHDAGDKAKELLKGGQS